jgi:hypothetical protein
LSDETILTYSAGATAEVFASVLGLPLLVATRLLIMPTTLIPVTLLPGSASDSLISLILQGHIGVGHSGIQEASEIAACQSVFLWSVVS